MHRRWIPPLPILALLLVTSGCLIESDLGAAGGGTMKVEYRTGKGDTLDKVKRQFASDNVEITSATMDDESRVAIAFKFKDFTKLNTSTFFREVTFTRTADAKAGTTTAKALLVHSKPMTLPDDTIQYFGNDVKISITVPGDIVKSNAAKTDGRTATWASDLKTLMSAKEVPFEVTFKTPADAPTAGAQTPAPTAKQ